MNSKSLNIVAFDVPFPANYGGVIDVFYKLKALHELSVNIILHTFEYGKGEQPELEKYCEKIYYYKRKTTLKKTISSLPFIVKTRSNKTLIKNLELNNYPILFEGIHCTYPIYKHTFKNRILIVRAHNIEHNYYKGLSKSEINIFKKLFFKYESYKLEKYETVLKKVNYILTISPTEQAYFYHKFPQKSIYIPAFNEHTKVDSKIGKGDFALYHGDLRVSDNARACLYLVEIFSKIDAQLIIASNFHNAKLKSEITKYNNVEYRKLISNEQLSELIASAQINILPTFQNTGIKLKLINALFLGRFCLVNNQMVENTGLESLCSIANSTNEFIFQIKHLMHQKFTQKQIEQRVDTLKIFDSQSNALKILELLS